MYEVKSSSFLTNEIGSLVQGAIKKLICVDISAQQTKIDCSMTMKVDLSSPESRFLHTVVATRHYLTWFLYLNALQTNLKTSHHPIYMNHHFIVRLNLYFSFGRKSLLNSRRFDSFSVRRLAFIYKIRQLNTEFIISLHFLAEHGISLDHEDLIKEAPSTHTRKSSLLVCALDNLVSLFV